MAEPTEPAVPPPVNPPASQPADAIEARILDVIGRVVPKMIADTTATVMREFAPTLVQEAAKAMQAALDRALAPTPTPPVAVSPGAGAVHPDAQGGLQGLMQLAQIFGLGGAPAGGGLGNVGALLEFARTLGQVNSAMMTPVLEAQHIARLETLRTFEVLSRSGGRVTSEAVEELSHRIGADGKAIKTEAPPPPSSWAEKVA